jgi:hypothetical protein
MSNQKLRKICANLLKVLAVYALQVRRFRCEHRKERFGYLEGAAQLPNSTDARLPSATLDKRYMTRVQLRSRSQLLLLDSRYGAGNSQCFAVVH